MIIALLGGQTDLAILCALIIGALLGFLWFNVHPAQVFMGDSGSLAMGATLAVVSLITGQILLLPLIGLIFVLEVGSDVLQIGYYKMTHKRIFKMAPLHHHFELSGLGRREDHDALLDHRRARGDARRDLLLLDAGRDAVERGG